MFVPLNYCPACRIFWNWENRRMARPACGKVLTEWCGQCYSNMKGRSNVPGHRNYRTPVTRRENRCMALSKPGLGGPNGSQLLPASSQTTYLSPFSDLMAFLSSPCWGDGSKRELGTLSLAVTSGRWSIRLKDPNGKRYAYVTGTTVDEVLEAAEKGLGDDHLDWREDKPFGRK